MSLHPCVRSAAVSGAAWSPADERRLELRVRCSVVVSDVEPPADLGLPRLGSWGAPPEETTWVHGAEATPSFVLSQIADATEVEIDAHGVVDPAQSAAAIIALSPESDGRFALSAADLTPGSLRQHPVIVLGACHAAKTAPYYHQAWSLPSAFVRAGARAVFASPDVVRDAEARPFFDGLLARIRAGAAPAVALRDERASWVARDPKGWVSSVMVFE
jgi:cellulose synthase operon protein C